MASKKTITAQQKVLLLEFLDEHPELVKNKQTNQFTNADTSRLWQEVTNKLNAIPGANKSWKEWRKTWSDIKTRTKRKISDNKKEAAKTGGGPGTTEVVDEVDDKILEIIGGDIVIEGLAIPELGIPTDLNPNWDHQYTQEKSVIEVEHETPNNNENLDPQSNTNFQKRNQISPQQQQKRVKPPLRVTNKRKYMGSNKVANQAAFDLVGVTERTNEIEENYYQQKMEQTKKNDEENLELRKEEIQLKKKEIKLKKEEIELRKEKLQLAKEKLKLKQEQLKSKKQQTMAQEKISESIGSFVCNM